MEYQSYTWGAPNLLTLLIFFPMFCAALLYALPFLRPERDTEGKMVRTFALCFTLIEFILSLLLLFIYEPTSQMQFVERASWIPTFGISYLVGLDGISIFLFLLTTFLTPIVVLSSHSIHHKIRGYLAQMLVLETAMLGTLASLDVFLFYVFWELMLAPMYFIIGIWGGKRRIYATLKFVLYTVVGSLLMLVAIMYVVWRYYEQQHEMTFVLDRLLYSTRLTFMEECWLFAAFALAFCIKVPLFPFHTWLPDAHVEAPTGGSVILAGVLLKMGLYGLIRFAYPLFPRGAEFFAPLLAFLAVVGIIYGALVAWAQHDMKKLVAYSSVSHLGYCVLGFVAFNLISTSGAIYQMLNHGVSTGALFLLVGVLYDRRHTREISEYGGLAAKVPVFAFLFLVFTLSSIALPLTNGFIGEFMILTGSFLSFPILTSFAVLGVVLGAVYMLTLYMKTMFGEIDEAKNGSLTDVTSTELATFLPLLILVFYMGLFPNAMLKSMEPTLKSYQTLVEKRSRQLLASEAGVPESKVRGMRAQYAWPDGPKENISYIEKEGR